jgi:hypothetical protein
MAAAVEREVGVEPGCLAGSTQALEESCRDVQIDVIGCVAQFSGRALPGNLE